ncbi:MurR/RpiR family transcriptional regulator [Chelativorans sp. Marseille-P2723]|uniref:MurR/RpiR family transcriptional regulator n=1 Tax=Chelativorans sp. Marseille-P2723 TaxID=2709133 RepID=UPI00156FB753|nr:MurR/RpiR family transcriptional regulator [Chelativorans sp. Marseille-P2723]
MKTAEHASGAVQGTIVNVLKARFPELSPRLRKAARYAIDNPEEIAVHSMRSVARRAGVHHNVMLRLAREIGYESYDEFRDLFRNIVMSGRRADWLHRAQAIRANYPKGPHGRLIGEYVYQELTNIQETFGEMAVNSLNQAVSLIEGARRVYVLGLRSLFPVAYYFHYVCRMFDRKTILLTGLGGTFADELRDVGDGDVLIAFSYHPYARDAVKAVEFARQRGTRIIAITDSLVSPIIDADSLNLIVNNNSRSLFPTLLPAFALAQVLATLLVSEGSEETIAAIARSQEQLDNFGVYTE